MPRPSSRSDFLQSDTQLQRTLSVFEGASTFGESLGSRHPKFAPRGRPGVRGLRVARLPMVGVAFFYVGDPSGIFDRLPPTITAHPTPTRRRAAPHTQRRLRADNARPPTPSRLTRSNLAVRCNRASRTARATNRAAANADLSPLQLRPRAAAFASHDRHSDPSHTHPTPRIVIRRSPVIVTT